MASELLGRCVCPECNFQSAHIKIKTDKEGAKAYRHCPECGAQYFPRSIAQDAQLRIKIKAAKLDEVKSPVVVPIVPVPKSEPLEQVEKKTRIVFGVRVPA